MRQRRPSILVRRRQRSVSAINDCRAMENIPTADPDSVRSALLRRMVGGDQAAEADVVAALDTTSSVDVLVAGAVLTDSTEPLHRARTLTVSPRERQLVVLAESHLEGSIDLFDALVRDHLASYPDHLLAAWLAGRQH
jgi:hypothetical protein